MQHGKMLKFFERERASGGGCATSLRLLTRSGCLDPVSHRERGRKDGWTDDHWSFFMGLNLMI